MGRGWFMEWYSCWQHLRRAAVCSAPAFAARYWDCTLGMIMTMTVCIYEQCGGEHLDMVSLQ
jgi:hypothetical protein